MSLKPGRPPRPSKQPDGEDEIQDLRDKGCRPGLKPLAPTHVFLRRFARNLAIGILITLFALGIGMAGYRHFEGMSWVDAYVNAAMILSGMGPVTELKTESGKLFAGSYALFSGILFLIVMAVVFAPVIRRFLHKFHLDETDK